MRTWLNQKVCRTTQNCTYQFIDLNGRHSWNKFRVLWPQKISVLSVCSAHIIVGKSPQSLIKGTIDKSDSVDDGVVEVTYSCPSGHWTSDCRSYYPPSCQRPKT